MCCVSSVCMRHARSTSGPDVPRAFAMLRPSAATTCDFCGTARAATLVSDRRARVFGFTLIELMVVIAIIAIGLGIAAPSMRNLTLNAQMSAQANDLLADLALARSEAIKRNVRVAICSSSTGLACTGGTPLRPGPWETGRIVFVDTNQNGSRDGDEDILRAAPEAPIGNTVAVVGDAAAGGARSVHYRPTGSMTWGGANVVFTLCAERAGSAGTGAGRRITINNTGRAVVTRRDCNA
jgi:type IV fimbrial biogenesis protein FimT